MSAVATETSHVTGPGRPPGLAERVIGEMTAVWRAQAEEFHRKTRAALNENVRNGGSEAGVATAMDSDAADTARTTLCLTLAELENRLTFIDARLREASAQHDIMTRLIWPPLFLDGPLSVWRTRIEDRLADAESGACELWLALARFNLALRRPEHLRPLAQAVDELGSSAYRFWKCAKEPVLDAALAWREALNELLATEHTPLEIVLALEGEPFDLDSMTTDDGGLGSRMTVKEPLSWIVKENVEPRARVLVPARVIAR